MDEFYNLNGILPVSTRQFLDLDEDASLRHSMDEYYNLNGILPVSTSQFLNLNNG